ncbi:MAG: SRPBCC domain-containing protein [Alphaproteobacteria bacterium]|nr:SRPBCC domain-containing protein [Alphaproteobacteria bacterium]
MTAQTAAARAPAETETDRTLVLTRVFKASPAAIYRAWTTAEALASWMGPRSIKTSDVGPLEVRPGGRYRIGMRGESGATHTVCGVYREVVPDRKLVFTWAWEDAASGKLGHESLVTISLRALGERTEMTLRHERFDSKGARDNHGEGWTGSFDKLVEWLAKG